MTLNQPASVQPASVSAALLQRLREAMAARGSDWLPFDDYMAMALYAPGLGYYANHSRKFGHLPASGSDFVTAPELSPLFGAAVARQVAQALAASGTSEVWEFGAGSGALAEQLLSALDALGQPVSRYTIVDLSSTLRARQAERLAAWGERVQWVSALPAHIDGVIVGNEVLDAMPVQLIRFDGQQWLERGVVFAEEGNGETLAWADRPTTLQPPVDEPLVFVPGTVTEVHPQAEAFISTLGAHLRRGAAFFIDYGFPAHEYYHPQRTGGTLMCHRAHLADDNPLIDVGVKDITAHVNFTGIALAAQEAGLEVLGYTSQARFLINCGLPALMDGQPPQVTSPAHKLIAEHELGELFKVIGLARGCDNALLQAPLGFVVGDRTHTL